MIKPNVASENPMSVESSSLEEILARLLQVRAELEERKRFFEEYDRLVLELKSKGFDKAIIGESVISLVDNFADGKNTSWTSAAVKRYDIKIESLEKHEKRLAKGVK